MLHAGIWNWGGGDGDHRTDDRSRAARLDQKLLARVSLSGNGPHGTDRSDYVCLCANRVLAVDQQRGSSGARNGSAAARAGSGTALRRFNLLRGRFPGSGGYTAAEHHEFGQHVVCTNFDGAVSGSPHGIARILDGDGLGAVFSRPDFSGPALPRKVDEKGDGVTGRVDLWGGLSPGRVDLWGILS